MLLQYLAVFGLGLLPSLTWLIFFDTSEEEHPEPFRDTLFAFIVGAVTTFAALIIQVTLIKFVPGIAQSQHQLLGIGLFSTIEEVLKFLAVFWLVSQRPSFKEPVDAMIYMITVALGFAAVENIATLINGGGLTAITSARSLEVVMLRFLGATLLHATTSAIVGFHWAVGWVRGKNLGLQIISGLVIAGVLHAAFNFLILSTGPAGWALALAAFIGLFVIIDFEELRTEEEDAKRAGIQYTKQQAI